MQRVNGELNRRASPCASLQQVADKLFQACQIKQMQRSFVGRLRDLLRMTVNNNSDARPVWRHVN
jgi:hypothetical protein